MTTMLLTLHVIVCLAMIVIVLLQAGKGADIGASFGAGSSQTVFGATGSAGFMGKLTASIAVIFMLTSLTLAYFYGQPGSSSVMPSTVVTEKAQSPLAVPAVQPAEAPAEGAEKK